MSGAIDSPTLHRTGDIDRRAIVWQRSRLIARSLCLLLALLALWPASDALVARRLATAMSPFVTVGATLAARTIVASAVPGLILALLLLWRRRWFCRWLCPTGLCADTASEAGKWCGRCAPHGPPIGMWILALTLGGALAGYPLLLWLDPLAILASAVAAVSGHREAVTLWSGAAALCVLGVSLLFPRLWCARLCPAGALQDLLASGVRWLGTTWRSARSQRDARRSLLTRRGVIFGALGLLGATLVGRIRPVSAGPVRPLGAVAESVFAGLCVRCGNCHRVCPSGVIRTESGPGGLATLLTPQVVFEQDYCREDCTRCSYVCPSGALLPVGLEQKLDAPMGLAHVDMDVCLLGENRDCSLCRSRCPYEAIRFVFSEETYTLTPVIDPARCPGCGACEAVCPTRPVRAMRVVTQ